MIKILENKFFRVPIHSHTFIYDIMGEPILTMSAVNNDVYDTDVKICVYVYSFINVIIIYYARILFGNTYVIIYIQRSSFSIIFIWLNLKLRFKHRL